VARGGFLARSRADVRRHSAQRLSPSKSLALAVGADGRGTVDWMGFHALVRVRLVPMPVPVPLDPIPLMDRSASALAILAARTAPRPGLEQAERGQQQSRPRPVRVLPIDPSIDGDVTRARMLLNPVASCRRAPRANQRPAAPTPSALRRRRSST
jgi:hypothetical protein